VQHRGVNALGQDAEQDIAHRLDEVGRWVTDFERAIENEQQLVEELRAGRFSIAEGSARE
jgi:hypothetical protein